MPLQNYQYDTIMREYNRRQARNRRIQEEHLAEAYEKIPRLREIDEEVATLSARKARALISRQEVGIEDLRNDIALLSQERTALLLSSGYPADYLEMSYTCPLCQDTGYVGSQKCACFKKAEIELLYTQSNLKEILEKENFDHFSFDFYSDTITNDSTGLSARETARRAYDIAQTFVRTFDSSFENLFLYGDTGVGKGQLYVVLGVADAVADLVQAAARKHRKGAAKGHQTGGGHAHGQVYHISLGNAAIKETVRKFFLEILGLGSAGQVGVQHYQLAVFVSDFGQVFTIGHTRSFLFHAIHPLSLAIRSGPADAAPHWGPCHASQPGFP